eukprot:SM000163S02297  [mRNA]  locus=s163:40841:42903:+ [translate_table: standard]
MVGAQILRQAEAELQIQAQLRRLRAASGQGQQDVAAAAAAAAAAAERESFHFESKPELLSLDDPAYYMLMPFVPDRQAVILLSKLPALLEKSNSNSKPPSVREKTRWLDQQISHQQCPYPIKHIEYTCTGDAVVLFVSEKAAKRALAQSPYKWESLEIPIRPCAEDDIRALYWIGISGAPQDLYPFVEQALLQFGEVRGEYPLHSSQTTRAGMLKYYFVPNPRKRIPPVIKFIRPDTPKGYPPTTVRVFTPDGALSPKCIDFGKEHSGNSCPECFRRKQQLQMQTAMVH